MDFESDTSAATNVYVGERVQNLTSFKNRKTSRRSMGFQSDTSPPPPQKGFVGAGFQCLRCFPEQTIRKIHSGSMGFDFNTSAAAQGFVGERVHIRFLKPSFFSSTAAAACLSKGAHTTKSFSCRAAPDRQSAQLQFG